MTRRTPVYIVCSPHARTGATTTARLLTDYHLDRKAAVEGFDADPYLSRFAETFPDRVRAVDIADIKGQIALFDRLLVQDGVPKVVDVWHRVYERFFSSVNDIGFFEEARQAGLEPILCFHVDATQRAYDHARTLKERWPDVRMVLVHNEGAAPLGENARDILLRYPARRKFVFPPLEGPVARALERERLSFAEFLAAPPQDMSIVVRAALRRWIIFGFMQFHRFELRLEFEQSDYLL